MEFLQGLAQIGFGSNAGVGLRAGHPPIQVLVVEVRKHDHLGFFFENLKFFFEMKFVG